MQCKFCSLYLQYVFSIKKNTYKIKNLLIQDMYLYVYVILTDIRDIKATDVLGYFLKDEYDKCQKECCQESKFFNKIFSYCGSVCLW